MDFESAGPAIVKSIKQRELLNFWLRLYARHERLPAFADYSPERLADESEDLVFGDRRRCVRQILVLDLLLAEKLLRRRHIRHRGLMVETGFLDLE